MTDRIQCIAAVGDHDHNAGRGPKLDGGTTERAARNLSSAFVMPVSHRSSPTPLTSRFRRLTEGRAAQLAVRRLVFKRGKVLLREVC